MPPPQFSQPTFDIEKFLGPLGEGHVARKFKKGGVIFSQGDPCQHVCHISVGVVKLSVLSRIGREAVIGMLGPGDFCGEACLSGQPTRTYTATAMSPAEVLFIEPQTMARLLHAQPAFADQFIAHMLSRSSRIESDLADQLFNSSERRLARTLLLLSRYGQSHPQTALPRISQQMLAEMIGTTRSRVNFFMNRFKRLGLIEGGRQIKINPALLGVVLYDDRTQEAEDDRKAGDATRVRKAPAPAPPRGRPARQASRGRSRHRR